MHGFTELARILQNTAADGDKSRMPLIMRRALRSWEEDVLIGPALLTPRHYVMRELLHDLAITSATIDAFSSACRYPASTLRQRRSTLRSSSGRTGLLR